MSKVRNNPEFGKSSYAVDPICGQLKVVFGGIVVAPMPPALASLADRLQDALERGDLSDPMGGPRSR